MGDRGSNTNLQDRTKNRSESLDSTSNHEWSAHGSIFDLSGGPDIIPKHNEAATLWNSNDGSNNINTYWLGSYVSACFTGFLPITIIIFNQIIIIVTFLRYLEGLTLPGKPAIVGMISHYSDASDSNTLKAELLELHKTIHELYQKYQDVKEWGHDLTDMVQSGLLKEKLRFMCNIDLKIREAIQLYDADKIGLIDYALESSGTAIVSTPETTPIKSKYIYKLLNFFVYDPSSNPATIIQPGIMPGQCFAFEGHSGNVRIKLSKEIIVNSVTLEHTHKQVTSDFRSAPKDFQVYGLLSADDSRGDKLGEFVYEINGYQLQMFQVDNMAGRAYQFIELRIANNYGHPEYTCVYRFRVHSYTY